MAYLVYQKDIEPLVCGNDYLALARFEDYDASRLTPILKSLGYIGEIPESPAEFFAQVKKANGLSYVVGVAVLEEIAIGNPDHPLINGETELVDGKWKRSILYDDQPAPPPDYSTQIKAEAERRITDFVPMWKQQNIQRRMIALLERGKTKWTDDEIAEVERIRVGNNLIDAIRTASDVLEALEPQPADYADDKHWPSEA